MKRSRKTVTFNDADNQLLAFDPSDTSSKSPSPEKLRHSSPSILKKALKEQMLQEQSEVQIKTRDLKNSIESTKDDNDDNEDQVKINNENESDNRIFIGRPTPESEYETSPSPDRNTDDYNDDLVEKTYSFMD